MSRRGQVKTELPLDLSTAVSGGVDTKPEASSNKVQAKKGRKKKNAEADSKTEEGGGLKQGLITDHLPVEKKKRKIDRFNGMPEEEVLQRLLPDRLAHNLDILIIGINPGLFAAYIGHHYAGPGNHFWKCLYLSGLVPQPMNCYDDIKLMEYGIGFTNMCARTTRGSADLNRKEILEGGQILTEKLKEYKPKIAVFNGKGIYEVFSGSKKITFGKQHGLIEGTESIAYVMPSSSARCAQLPRAVDKVPFYEALRHLRDYVVGRIPHLDESSVRFPTLELKNVKKEAPPSLANNESQAGSAGAGGGEGGEGAAQSLANPQPAVKKEKATRGRGKGKTQVESGEESSKDTAADDVGEMQSAYFQTQGSQPTTTTTNSTGPGHNSQLPLQTSSPHIATAPGTNGVVANHSVMDFTSLRSSGHPPQPASLPGFFSMASQNFMAGFYAGSQTFGMVGFPNAVATLQGSGGGAGAPGLRDNASLESVEIKAEPVDP